MAHRPDDSVFGEEFGGTPAFTGRQWVLDPIDGTKNFVRGVPVWSTLIALLVDGIPVVGVVSAPALDAGGGPARARARSRRSAAPRGPSRCPASTTSARRSLSFSDLPPVGCDATRRFIDLTDAVWRVRAYGDFWSYCLVAEGAVDIAAEPEVNAVGPGPARHPRA